MNYKKSEFFEEQGNNANSSNINRNRQHSSKFQRQTSVIPTFFRWFKKSNPRQHQQINSTRSDIETTPHLYDTSSRESLHFNFENYSENSLSPSLSCDSVLSTSTTGFAFINPNKYGNSVEPKILSDSQIENNSSPRRFNDNSDQSTKEINAICKTQPKLTLKQKYFLFESDTLKSSESASDFNSPSQSFETNSNYDKISCVVDESDLIPNDIKICFGEGKGHSEEPVVPTRRGRSRRTASDSSKELRSGAYVHVKGKRKAPSPPSCTNSVAIFSKNSNLFQKSYTEINENNYRTLSPVSTTGRKKRKAPPPPLLTKFLSDKLNLEKQYDKSPSFSRKLLSSNCSLRDKNNGKFETETTFFESFSKTNTAIEEQENNNKVILNKSFTAAEHMPASPIKQLMENTCTIKNSSNIGNHLKFLNNSDISNSTISSTPPQSPISPRPWYKRPISINRESAIPFKREVILKTVEKSKSKHKDSPESALPEVSFSRSSIFDNENKLNLYARLKDIKNSKSSKENRYSNINMPNISELDREAAEILTNESKSPNWFENKTYNPPEHLKLDQEMFTKTDTIINKNDNSITSKIKGDYDRENEKNTENVQSAKDLINKFEIQTEKPKVTVNPTYIAKTKSFVGNVTPDKYDKTESVLVIKESPILKRGSNSINDSVTSKYSIQHSHGKLTWTCSYCTLENPNWRIICEVCEHLKSFENRLEDESKILVTETKKPIINKLIKSTSPQNSQISAEDWKWKAEIVKKYFPKSGDVNVDSTNSSKLESIFDKSPKYFSAELPIPNTKEQNKQSIPQNENSNNIFTSQQFDEKLNVNENLQSPVNNNINIEQIRIARLAKFSISSPSNNESSRNIENYEEKENFLKDPNSLEMEKQRLREKIRAMNAKALAEKYPLVKKSLSLDDSNADSQISSRDKSKEYCTENQIPISSVTLIIEAKSLDPSLLQKERNPDYIPNCVKVCSEKKTEKSLNTEKTLYILQDNATKQIKSQISEIDISNPANVHNSNHKSGAIKKVLTNDAIPLEMSNKDLKTQLKAPNKLPSDIYMQQSKPNKVSSSCQTSGLIKKSNEYDTKTNIYLNALGSPIKNYKFENDEIKLNSKTNLKNNNGDSVVLYKEFSHFDKEKIKKISRNLISAKGRTNFKMTLDKEHVNGISHTDTLVLNKILRNLEQAISEGKHELAAKLAMDLAKMKVSLQVTKLKSKKSHPFDSGQNFIVDMFIEDRISQKGPIQISINPFMTVNDLKKKSSG